MDEKRLNEAIANAQILMNDPKFINLNDTKSASNKKRKIKPLFESMWCTQSQTPNVDENNESLDETLNEQRFQNDVMLKSQKMYSNLKEQYQNVQQQNLYGTQQNNTMAQNNGIDYSIIKAIVNECLKEYSKQQLNEGVVSGLRFAKGNKIQFLDSKGNLYEGVLTLKRKSK